VERFGGFDTSATYSVTGTAATTNLGGAAGEAAKFVYPIGMAVDSEASNAPDKYAVYVLENVNPQAFDAKAARSNASTSVSLQYRIQKLSDTGLVLASTTFTLVSSQAEPGLHAVSLAVDGPAERVYVLTMDVPPVENARSKDAVDSIDAWTTELTPAVKITTGIADDLPPDPNVTAGPGAGELAGPGSLQQPDFAGDIDGEGITVYGTGATADLALAGNKYTTANAWAEETKPTIELITTAGPHAGTVESSAWTDAADTEDAAATAVSQASQELYSMSSDSNGSLNVSLGPFNGPIVGADLEPNMATVGTDALSPTVAVLPGSIVAENESEPTTAGTNSRYNIDGAATTGFTQDIDEDGGTAFAPESATNFVGTLAPSVVQLAGGADFPSELYAGVFAAPGSFGKDGQNPAGTPYVWKEASGKEEQGQIAIAAPASLAIRIFNPSSDSLAMIGNIVPGGPCNLQGSPVLYGGSGRPSFVALAPGREGVVFALVQPDLNNATVADATEPISPDPSSSVGAGSGDQVVEFAPGADNSGAGQNAAKWQECPQPSGSFSITDKGVKEPTTGEITVESGTALAFNAGEMNNGGEINLRGGTPWAYDWDLEGGVNEKGEGPLLESPWTVGNNSTATPKDGRAWTWPLSSVEAEFNKPGAYTETLKLVNDFGTLTGQRTLRVVAPGAITGTKIAPSSKPIEGEPTVLNASEILPEGDKVKDYHWEFGDGQSEDTGEAAAVEHTYAKAGTYTVILTITDALGQKVQAEEKVTVAEAEKSQGPGTTTNTNTTTTDITTTPTATTPVVTKPTIPATKPKTPTTAQKLADALKVCKKDKSKKQRATCEKLAKKKYATKSKSKPKKNATKKK
jgi:hypothetical protein